MVKHRKRNTAKMESKVDIAAAQSCKSFLFSTKSQRSKADINLAGIGEMTTLSFNKENNSKKVSGKITFFKNNSEDSEVLSSLIGENALLWVVYVHKDNPENMQTQTNLRAAIYSSILGSTFNLVDISLIKVKKLDGNAIFFDGFEDHLVDQCLVLNILPFESEYHKNDNFVISNEDISEKTSNSNFKKIDFEDIKVEGDFTVNEASMDIFDNGNLSGSECSETKHEPSQNLEVKNKVEIKEMPTDCFGIPDTEKRKHSHKCPECSMSFPYKKDLKKHHMDTHKVYHCHQCKQNYHIYNNFRKHKLKCNRNQEEVFQCDICKKVLKYKQSLPQHFRLHSGEAWKHQCPTCGKVFSQKKTLEVHIAFVHTEEKPFKCADCGYSTATKGRLQCHMRIHTGEKPYCCEICGTRFTLSATLAEHRRRHTGEKPYKCRFCDRRFTAGKGLRTHLLTHTRYSLNA